MGGGEQGVGGGGGELPAGLSAEVTIPFDSVPAHRVSAALGRLDEEGAHRDCTFWTRKTASSFMPIEIIPGQGPMASGSRDFPSGPRIVTISQGTLRPGQQVEGPGDA